MKFYDIKSKIPIEPYKFINIRKPNLKHPRIEVYMDKVNIQLLMEHISYYGGISFDRIDIRNLEHFNIKLKRKYKDLYI
jgi:hypothetical protein